MSLSKRFKALKLNRDECLEIRQNRQTDSPKKHIKNTGSNKHREQGLSGHCINTSATKKEWRVLEIGNFLVEGTEAPICHPDNLFREVCCLPGAHLETLGRLYHNSLNLKTTILLLTLRLGPGMRKLKNVKKDFTSLEKMLKGSGM